MKQIKKIIKFAVILFVFVSCFFLLFTKQYENYRIINISMQKVDLLTKDSDLIIDKVHRNYYLLHFDIEYYNYKYRFLHTPNPNFIKGSANQIKSVYIYDSLKNNIGNYFSSLKIKNIFTISNNNPQCYRYCCSFASLNELIQQINDGKIYGAHRNIENDCLLYLESTHNLPRKIVFQFSTYSIESLINNKPCVLNLEKYKYNGKATYYDWW